MGSEEKIAILQRRVDDLLALVVLLNAALERSTVLDNGTLPAALLDAGDADMANLAGMVEHGWTWRRRPYGKDF